MATYPPDILRELKDLQRRVQNLKTTPQPPNIQLSNTATAIFDLAPVSAVTLTATLEDEQGGRLLAQPNVTLFKTDPPTTTNIFPDGSEWSTDDQFNINFYSWLDWGGTNNSNVVLKIVIINGSATGYSDMCIKVNMRFMTRGGAL